VEEVLPRLRRPDLVLANPPRAGLAPKVVDAIAAQRPQRLVYVSCDPATLARDVRRLGAGWQVDSIMAFDLFPQTAHVETVLAMRPA
jgi:23S rRNA (uracil1939-C5)-methyltransferase